MQFSESFVQTSAHAVLLYRKLKMFVPFILMIIFLLKHRQVLLEIFSRNYRVRRNVIQNQLSQECGEDVNKQELDRVLKVSFCSVVVLIQLMHEFLMLWFDQGIFYLELTSERDARTIAVGMWTEPGFQPVFLKLALVSFYLLSL